MKKIRRWRLEQSIERTFKRRPDLIDNLALTDEQATMLANVVEKHNS
jgi:tRNA (guanine37-N1)-methyltransferase